MVKICVVGFSIFMNIENLITGNPQAHHLTPLW